MNLTTINNWNNIKADYELAEAIELEYYRFEPYLKHALQELVSLQDSDYVYEK